MSVVLLIGGLVAIVLGAEGLVRGGGRLALILRVPPVIVGLTLVAWGTSAPELVVSLTAAARASTEMALGNVVGSSIANIALVLAVAGLLAPLPAEHGLKRRDYAVLLLAQAALPLMLFDGRIGRIDGVSLLTLGVAYNLMLIHRARHGRRAAAPVDPDVVRVERWPMYLGVVVAGALLLAFGSSWFVEGASQIARALGVSDRVVGLTIVAVGTSSPELATSVVASLRGQHDVSVGNIVGSNIFNTLLALGPTAVIFPVTVSSPGRTWIDLLVALGLTLALAPFLRRRTPVPRAYGGTLFAVYLAYVTYLVVL